MQTVHVMSWADRARRLWVLVGIAVVASLLVPSSAGAVAGTPQDPTAESLGNNTVEVNWKTVPDAVRYLVDYSTRSSFSSSTTSTYTGDDNLTKTVAYIEGLSRDTKYYFRVYAVDAAGDKSEPSTTVDATPKYEYGRVDGISTRNIGTTFAEVEWVFNTATLGTPGWRLRAENKADRSEAHINDIGSDPNGKITGLKRNTTYYVWVASLLPVNGDAPAVRVGPYSKAIKITTSNFDVSGPSELKMTVQKSTEITLAWTAPDILPAGYKYVVEYGTNASVTKDVKRAEATSATSKKVTGLTPNVNYFMRVYVVDSNGTTRKSDSSDVLQTKTPTSRGTITGNVTGIPTNALKDLVVTAYQTKAGAGDEGNLVEEADVDRNGNYTIAVRPGTYRIHASYTGSSNYTSLWARKDSVGAVNWADGSDQPVVANANRQAPTVTLGTGGKVEGTVRDPYVAEGETKGAPLPAVDVTARSCWSELVGKRYDRDVMAVATTNSQGAYTLDGLPDGAYWLRFIYKSGDGFGASATAVKLKDHKVVSHLEAGESCLSMPDRYSDADVNVVMQEKDFRKKYSIHVYGKRKVGTTLKTKFNKWLGSQYGSSATRSRMEWVWTRNGVDIPGTSGNTHDNGYPPDDFCSSIRCFPRYKLTSKDRRKYISLKVTYSDYGYITQTKTYRKFKVR